ncbi:class I SAM-dependent methyltransferase [Geotalea sp. SG265]|uniref:class I SAM-dependent methyltransferase n=1 Tax=Geotalea sp. SG265 TaxID=2922867 RepID=UPI001FAF939E|nr:class I SAM-dependent methyltransferase [Geotalea sp. SG265]
MQWYPTPSYLLKRKVILDFLGTVTVDDFLEIGCGAGDLLLALAERGYKGTGIDLSDDAVLTAREKVANTLITVAKGEIRAVAGKFDVAIASEVLEHCEDDVGMMRELAAKVRPGGYVVLTVPAHMSKWGANDDFCGHIRRYEREELHDKLVAAGLRPIRIYSYGVPVYNLMKPFYDHAISKRRCEERDLQVRTKESSGMWLFTGMQKLFFLLFNDLTMYPFYLLQQLFFKTDLGNGYFAVARPMEQQGD